jgi:hypothetical protein
MKTESLQLRRMISASEEFKSLSESLIQKSKSHTENQIKTKHLSKFNPLILKNQPRNFNETSSPPLPTTIRKSDQLKTVINISNKVLTNEESEILVLGLNFAFPSKSKKADLVESALSIECILHNSDTDENIKNIVRQDIAQELRRESTIQEKNKHTPFIPIVNSLRKDTNIVILRADKGNSTVIMNRNDYETKITDMLAEGP